MTYSLLFLALVAILFTSVHSGAVLTENKCPGTMYEVRITDCTSYPCRLRKGRDYQVEIDFTPTQNTSTLSILCDTVYYGKAYQIPEHQICSDLSTEKCPLNNFTKYTYSIKFNIAYIVPSGKYPIRCGMLDDSKMEQICPEAVGTIVDF